MQDAFDRLERAGFEPSAHLTGPSDLATLAVTQPEPVVVVEVPEGRNAMSVDTMSIIAKTTGEGFGGLTEQICATGFVISGPDKQANQSVRKASGVCGHH